jgi:hypothetical protein
MLFDVIIHNFSEFSGNIVATQGNRLFAIDKYRRYR